MVGENLELVKKLVELAVECNLQQLTVGDITIVARPKQPKIDLTALSKQLQSEAKISDEDILMNPYAGMNNLPTKEAN